MIGFPLVDGEGFLTPYGVQQTDRFARLSGWQPFPAGLPFTTEDGENMTDPALVWMTQASSLAGLPAPATRGKAGFAILRVQGGLAQ